jgi:hypothetical protein
MNAEARNGTTRKVTLWVLTGFCVCLVVFAIAVASVFKREGMSPLHRAVQVNSPIALRSFLFFGTNPNSADKASGDTPLHYAARQGRADMVSILLNRKAGVDTPNNSGETPLHIASYAGNTPVVQLLVDAGTDLKKKEKKYGATPFILPATKTTETQSSPSSVAARTWTCSTPTVPRLCTMPLSAMRDSPPKHFLPGDRTQSMRETGTKTRRFSRRAAKVALT